ncbi:MAG: hypothetical protein ABSF99_05385, partial [Anaerolineales bacterium]
PAGPHVARPEQDVPVPNQQEVYSQMLPATSLSRGVDMLTLLSHLNGYERWDKWLTDQSQIECIQDRLPILPGS